MADRERWRFTFGELQEAAQTTANELDHWADLGALGADIRERGKSARWRHINRSMAQRAVLMNRLITAGMTETEAAYLARQHKVQQLEPLVIELSDFVIITISRADLP